MRVPRKTGAAMLLAAIFALVAVRAAASPGSILIEVRGDGFSLAAAVCGVRLSLAVRP